MESAGGQAEDPRPTPLNRWASFSYELYCIHAQRASTNNGARLLAALVLSESVLLYYDAYGQFTEALTDFAGAVGAFVMPSHHYRSLR